MSATQLGGGPYDVTVLEARVPCHKTIHADGRIEARGKAKWFRAASVIVPDANAMYRLVQRLLTCRRVLVVRGAVRPNADPRRMRRLAHDRLDEQTGELFERTLEDVPKAWAKLDVDNAPARRPDWFMPEHAVDEIRWFVDSTSRPSSGSVPSSRQ
ncbi:hypothetical protein [Geminicoccus flavidas]|uniref:hypothetical protein n=1 Tax=Geminicoccus flavidas TaxID=2506407 RepID=UPI00135C616A|nr:hypothetical protein [Geminicoccus flavidas]